MENVLLDRLVVEFGVERRHRLEGAAHIEQDRGLGRSAALASRPQRKNVANDAAERIAIHH
ncbi:hypothetical protein [Caballeronia sp. LZ035]|uniref:hypothetical protein n=1 Tax=Caballeronia sp. LZ035 TaxID=3038568 RepID=UPI002855CEDC|nr:hypothetical protein [Caballeronia sp. LZ035]MDR5758946.1 hypothetical protein [Caballeronia sp. LZ035]